MCWLPHVKVYINTQDHFKCGGSKLFYVDLYVFIDIRANPLSTKGSSWYITVRTTLMLIHDQGIDKFQTRIFASLFAAWTEFYLHSLVEFSPLRQSAHQRPGPYNFLGPIKEFSTERRIAWAPYSLYLRNLFIAFHLNSLNPSDIKSPRFFV